VRSTSKSQRDFTTESTEFTENCDSQARMPDLVAPEWGNDLIAWGDFAREHRK